MLISAGQTVISRCQQCALRLAHLSRFVLLIVGLRVYELKHKFIIHVIIQDRQMLVLFESNSSIWALWQAKNQAEAEG